LAEKKPTLTISGDQPGGLRLSTRRERRRLRSGFMECKLSALAQVFWDSDLINTKEKTPKEIENARLAFLQREARPRSAARRAGAHKLQAPLRGVGRSAWIRAPMSSHPLDGAECLKNGECMSQAITGLHQNDRAPPSYGMNAPEWRRKYTHAATEPTAAPAR
jgi:hypothetical protein